ncbi:MAG: sigma-70 family RNA polymerase sigma factor [Acidimicrobiales bacterium]
MDRLTELALAARDGNAYALEEFVRRSQPQVRALCRHLGDPDTVDDLTQEVYYRALRSLPRYRNDGPAIGWLLTIARRTCADATRRRVRHRRRAGSVPAVEEAAHDASWADVADLVATLDADRRQAFVLTQFVGLSYADAAQVLGCPVGTVRSRVSRARADLIETMAAGDADRGTDSATD